jgi:hypothetical protein
LRWTSSIIVDGVMPGWNLKLRSALEIGALMGFGLVGYDLINGPTKWLVVVVIVVAASTIWTIFAVPGDPTRRNRAPLVPVPGPLRLVLELLVLGGGVLAFAFNGAWLFAVALTMLIVVHSAFSGRRLRWLLLQK